MRVLLVTDWVRPRGGVETYVETLRDGLRAAGDDVRLLTSTAGDPRDAGADFLAPAPRSRAMQAVTQVANPAAAVAVRRAIARFRPDVVQVHMFALHLSPAIFAALGTTPTVLLVNDYKPICPTGWKLLPDGSICTHRAGLVCLRKGCTSAPHWLRDRPRYRLFAAALRRADRILACSGTVQRALARDGISAEAVLLPTAAPVAKPHQPAADPLFVFCGRLSPEKGVAPLLRAFARARAAAPRARLRLVGRGPEQPALERLAAGLGVEGAVDFRGWVPGPRVAAELRDAWALVAPSLHAEPLGLVALEALVAGVPVIASRTGGFSETVREGAGGVLLPNGDEDALARCLASFARGDLFPGHRVDPEEVARVRAAHDVGAHVARLRMIYAELAGRRRATAQAAYDSGR